MSMYNEYVRWGYVWTDPNDWTEVIKFINIFKFTYSLLNFNLKYPDQVLKIYFFVFILSLDVCLFASHYRLWKES